MPQPFPSSGAGCSDAALVTVSGNGQFAAYDFFPDDGSPSRIFRVAL